MIGLVLLFVLFAICWFVIICFKLLGLQINPRKCNKLWPSNFIFVILLFRNHCSSVTRNSQHLSCNQSSKSHGKAAMPVLTPAPPYILLPPPPTPPLYPSPHHPSSPTPPHPTSLYPPPPIPYPTSLYLSPYLPLSPTPIPYPPIYIPHPISLYSTPFTYIATPPPYAPHPTSLYLNPTTLSLTD